MTQLRNKLNFLSGLSSLLDKLRKSLIQIYELIYTREFGTNSGNWPTEIANKRDGCSSEFNFESTRKLGSIIRQWKNELEYV